MAKRKKWHDQALTPTSKVEQETRQAIADSRRTPQEDARLRELAQKEGVSPRDLMHIWRGELIDAVGRVRSRRHQ